MNVPSASSLPHLNELNENIHKIPEQKTSVKLPLSKKIGWGYQYSVLVCFTVLFSGNRELKKVSFARQHSNNKFKMHEYGSPHQAACKTVT